MDEVLKVLAETAKVGIENDRKILDVIKVLAERHLELEALVADLNERIASIVNRLN